VHRQRGQMSITHTHTHTHTQDACNVGDEGGFAPNIPDNKEGLQLLVEVFVCVCVCVYGLYAVLRTNKEGTQLLVQVCVYSYTPTPVHTRTKAHQHNTHTHIPPNPPALPPPYRPTHRRSPTRDTRARSRLVWTWRRRSSTRSSP
jgi:hypothetical protein